MKEGWGVSNCDCLLTRKVLNPTEKVRYEEAETELCSQESK